jgi:hypothetical protein
MQDCSKTERVLDCPRPCLERLRLDFVHAEMDWLTQQDVVVSQTFGPLQAEDIGGSGGLSRTGCMDIAPFISQCCPHQHYKWVSYPPYPYFVVSSFLQASGWP